MDLKIQYFPSTSGQNWQILRNCCLVRELENILFSSQSVSDPDLKRDLVLDPDLAGIWKDPVTDLHSLILDMHPATDLDPAKDSVLDLDPAGNYNGVLDPVFYGGSDPAGRV